MSYYPAPGMSSPNQQHIAAYDRQTHHPVATKPRQTRTVQFGEVSLADVLHQVQPTSHHVQQRQYGDQPGVRYAHKLQHHPNPYPHQGNFSQYRPNQGVSSLQPHHQATRHQEPIVELADEYRVSSQNNGANWRSVNYNHQANHLRASGPSDVTDQWPATGQTELDPCRTARPRCHVQDQQSGMSSSSNNPSQTVRNAPRYPPGLRLPLAIPQQCVPLRPVQSSNLQGYDAPRQIPLGNVPQPAPFPTPNHGLDTLNATPTRAMVLKFGNNCNARAVEPSEHDDSSSEARTDTDSIAGASLSETAYTSVASDSEDCSSPPATATQCMYTPRAKDPLNDDMRVMVAGCVKKYKEEGPDALLNELVNDGTRDHRRSLWNATATRLILEQLEMQGVPEVEGFKKALRSEALRRFTDYWNTGGEWKSDNVRPPERPYLMLRGVNIAGFIGSLFRVAVLDGGDVHMCLDLLVGNLMHVHFFLCAMHALVTHCDETLCSNVYWPRTSQLVTKLTAQHLPTGEMKGGSDDVTRFLIDDLLGILDRFRATVELQTIRDSVDPLKMKTKVEA